MGLKTIIGTSNIHLDQVLSNKICLMSKITRQQPTGLNSATEDMLTLTCCQDHILKENIWFVWLETSYSGDERRCHRCGTNKQTNYQQLKIELLSKWKMEAESQNSYTYTEIYQYIYTLFDKKRYKSIYLGREFSAGLVDLPAPGD